MIEFIKFMISPEGLALGCYVTVAVAVVYLMLGKKR